MHEHEAFSPQQETAKRSRNSVQHLSSQFLSILGICPLSRLDLSLLPTSLKLLTTHYPRFLRSQPSSSQQVVEVGRDLPRGDLVVAAGQPAKVRPAAMTMRKRSESPQKQTKHGPSHRCVTVRADPARESQLVTRRGHSPWHQHSKFTFAPPLQREIPKYSDSILPGATRSVSYMSYTNKARWCIC